MLASTVIIFRIIDDGPITFGSLDCRVQLRRRATSGSEDFQVFDRFAQYEWDEDTVNEQVGYCLIEAMIEFGTQDPTIHHFLAVAEEGWLKRHGAPQEKIAEAGRRSDLFWRLAIAY